MSAPGSLTREASARREANEDVDLTDEEFDGFMTLLAEEGLAEEQLSDEGIRRYLRWRGRISVAQRMDNLGAEADIRMERDPVLSEAVRLLRTATTQEQLFQAADAEQARRSQGAGGL